MNLAIAAIAIAVVVLTLLGIAVYLDRRDSNKPTD